MARWTNIREKGAREREEMENDDDVDGDDGAGRKAGTGDLVGKQAKLLQLGDQLL